jgi:hypothetical protein
MSSILADQESALVYEPKCGWGRVAGSQPMSAAVQIKPKGDPTPYFAYDGQINEDEMAEKITLITTQADPGICCRR